MQPNRSRGTVTALASVALAAGTLIAACGGDAQYTGPEPILYEGSVVAPPNYPNFFGNVWLNAGPRAIGISAAFQSEPETTDGFYWTLREGSCEDAGAMIGEADDYPAIVLADDGTWSGSAHVPVSELPSLAMVIEYAPVSGDAEGELFHLGCATLRPTQ